MTGCAALRRASFLMLLLVAAAGCGAERVPVPDVDDATVAGERAPQSYPQAGLTFDAPVDWGFAKGAAPLVASTSNGTGSVAIWRYKRTEALPAKTSQLDSAQAALLDAVKQRDPTYEQVSAKQTKVDGKPAIELVGDQRIAGRPRRVRSTHVYAGAAELVIDQYAAPSDFDRLDEAVFVPLVRSVRLDEPES